MIACIDGGIFCIGVPALLVVVFPFLGKWLKKRCKCRHAKTSKASDGTLR